MIKHPSTAEYAHPSYATQKPHRGPFIPEYFHYARAERGRFDAFVAKLGEWVGVADSCEHCVDGLLPDRQLRTFVRCDECGGTGIDLTKRHELITAIGEAIQRRDAWIALAREHRCETERGECGGCYGCEIRIGWLITPSRVRDFEPHQAFRTGQDWVLAWEKQQ